MPTDMSDVKAQTTTKERSTSDQSPMVLMFCAPVLYRTNVFFHFSGNILSTFSYKGLADLIMYGVRNVGNADTATAMGYR